LKKPRKKGKDTINCYRVIFEELKRSRKIEQALKYFEDFKAKFQPDGEIYDQLLELCASVGRGGRTNILFKELKAQNIQPTVRTYNALIETQRHLENPVEATVLYNEMKSNNIEPNLNTYLKMIAVNAKAGIFNEANIYVEEMKRANCFKGNEALAYGPILDACRHGNYPLVEELHKMSLNSNFQINPVILDQAYSSMILEEKRKRTIIENRFTLNMDRL